MTPLVMVKKNSKVRGRKMMVQIGFLAVAGARLYVGRRNGEPLTDDGPAEPSLTITGGTLHQVSAKVSGYPYATLNHYLGCCEPTRKRKS